MLALLLVLPVIYWLLRMIPPLPKLVRFPAIRLLIGLEPTEQTPMKMPWWLLLLRLLLATALILAVARPLLNPQADLPGKGPLMLVIDDGWSSAPGWTTRIAHAERLIQRAERAQRPVVLTGTAPAAARCAGGAQGRHAARRGPHPPARLPAQALADRPRRRRHRHRPDAGRSRRLCRVAERRPGGRRRAPSSPSACAASTACRSCCPTRRPRRCCCCRPPPKAATSRCRRCGPSPTARARSPSRRPTSRAAWWPASSSTSPPPRPRAKACCRRRPSCATAWRGSTSRRRAARAARCCSTSAHRRRPVSILGERPTASGQPLMQEVYFLERALDPYVSLVDRRSRDGADPQHRRAADPRWRRALGQRPRGDRQVDRARRHRRALRRPQPRPGNDPLVPTPLRLGDRALGGVMSWGQPTALAEFPANSPFLGIPIPKDVRISQQVLAEPTPDLADKTWARLADGTPLVTGREARAGLPGADPHHRQHRLEQHGAERPVREHAAAAGHAVARRRRRRRQQGAEAVAHPRRLRPAGRAAGRRADAAGRRQRDVQAQADHAARPLRRRERPGRLQHRRPRRRAQAAGAARRRRDRQAVAKAARPTCRAGSCWARCCCCWPTSSSRCGCAG